MQKQLADFLGSGLIHVCEGELLDALAAGVRSGVIHLERAIAEVAGHQHGVITLEQLLVLGLTRPALDSRLKSGRLHRLYRGVCLLGSPLPAPFALDLGAVLACGRDSYLSHASALAARGVLPVPPAERHVTTVGRQVRTAAMTTHEVADLHAADISTFQGIPMTSVPRALIEIAGTHDPESVADAVERAQVKQLVTAHSLNAAVERAPRRAGVGVIRDLLSMPQFTRSKAERMVLDLCRQAGLPLPEVNQRLDGDEVDFLWRRHRVLLEFDGYAFHASHAAFERDRQRDADRQRAGWIHLRTTWRELTERPYELVARLAEALARGAAFAA